MELLARLNAEERITIVLVTHEPDIAEVRARGWCASSTGRITHDGGVSVDAIEEALA